MMRLNPIIKREIEIKNRSLTLPVAITVINAVLFGIGIAGTSAEVLQMRTSYTLNYGAFLKIYVAVILMQFVMIMFTAPVLTADVVAGERERGTFDLLLTTRLTAGEIVAEKLISAYINMAMIVVSGLPAMLIPLMFGGVHIQSTIVMLLILLIEAFMIMSVGMLVSCYCRSSVKSIVISYACMIALTAGPIVLGGLAGLFSSDGGNGLIYLTAIDPLLPVVTLLSAQIGEGSAIPETVYMMLNGTPDAAFTEHAVLIGLMVQAAIAFACIVLAVIHIMPHKNLRTAAGEIELVHKLIQGRKSS